MGLVSNVAPSSSGVEAVDDGMRSSRSARNRQHLADDVSRMMAQAPTRITTTRPGRECQAEGTQPVRLRAPFPAFSPTFPGCYRPGMAKSKRVSWFHPPRRLRNGGVVSCHGETAIFLDKCQTRLPAGLPCCCALVCASLTLYDTGMVITVCYIRVVQTKLQQGLVALSRQRYPWPCNSFREECGGGSGQATLVLFW